MNFYLLNVGVRRWETFKFFEQLAHHCWKLKFNSFKKSVMLVKLLAMHIFSTKVLIISLLQYGTIRLMYASDPDLAYLTENMKTDLSFYDKAELNAFYQCTGMVIYHLSHICLKKNLVELTGFFFIIITFEFIWFFCLGVG